MSEHTDPNKEFDIHDLIEIVKLHGIINIEINPERREMTIGNADDLHRFMIATGVARPVLGDDGKPSKYPNGVPKIELLDDNRVRILDSSGYGKPYYTHSVSFQIGTTEPWQIVANHRVSKPE